LELARRAGASTLLFHRALEALAVHGHAALGGDLLGELEREAIRVVEREGVLAADAPGATGQQVVETRESGLEGLHEAVLLARQDPDDLIMVLTELAVVPAELFDHAARAGGEERALDPERAARPAARHR